MRILIIMLIASSSYGQCKGVESTKDEFTGAITTKTKWERVAPGVIALVLKHNNTVGVMFYADLGCVSASDSKVYFKFSDGEVVTLPHAGEINCGDNVAIAVSINDYLEDFTTKTVSKVRLVGDRVINFDMSKPDLIGNTLNNCFDLSQL